MSRPSGIMEPHVHDCDACVWVGWYCPTMNARPANVYLCGGKTVIIRYSSEGSDYWSATAGETVKGSISLGPGIAS